jgi:hypothetical protein
MATAMVYRALNFAMSDLLSLFHVLFAVFTFRCEYTRLAI